MPTSRRVTIRTTVATAGALAGALVPVFLFGALSDQIRADVAFGDAGIGAGVTVFFVAAALGAVPGGLVTERIGPRRAMLLGVGLAGLASVGIGLLATSWWAIAGLLGLAGSAVGLIDTGGARAFADVVPPRRQGLAFGVKEASVPAASMVAGAAVPLLALTIGWRATFVATAVLVPVVWALLPSHVGRERPAPPLAGRARPSRRALLLLALGAVAGTGAATAAASYLVPAGTATGLSPARAGTLLAMGSALGITMRLLVGWRADRTPRPQLPVVALLLGVGAIGPLVLALGRPGAAIVGGLLALGAGWGWTGLVFLVAVRADPTAPAAAAGVVLAGLSTGGALGPLLFGLIVAGAGYPSAWAVAAASMAVGAGAIIASHRAMPSGPRAARPDASASGVDR
jgi:predicted MFS family arabinose efflux permease